MIINKKRTVLIGVIFFILFVIGEIILHVVIQLNDFISNKKMVSLIMVITGMCLVLSVVLVKALKKKFRRKNLVVICIVLVILSIFSIYHIFIYENVLISSADSEIWDQIIAEYESGETEIDFAEIIPFEWDVAYSVYTFVSEEELIKNAEQHYKQIANIPYLKNYDLSDMSSILCVFKDDKLVFVGGITYIDIYPANYDKFQSYCYKFNKKNAKFVIASNERYHFDVVSVDETQAAEAHNID